jgi:hypothetical protein
MKTTIWLAVIIVFGMIACGKDKFETVPQLTLRSKTPEVVPVNGTLRLNIEYTDKEGDVSDSLFIVRQRLNVRGPIQLTPSPYDVPDFPHTDKGEFEISLEYQVGLIFGLPPLRIPGSNPVRNEIDTLRLKIVAKDKAGNKSDTLVVDNVYVIR